MHRSPASLFAQGCKSYGLWWILARTLWFIRIPSPACSGPCNMFFVGLRYCRYTRRSCTIQCRCLSHFVVHRTQLVRHSTPPTSEIFRLKAMAGILYPVLLVGGLYANWFSTKDSMDSVWSDSLHLRTILGVSLLCLALCLHPSLNCQVRAEGAVKLSPFPSGRVISQRKLQKDVQVADQFHLAGTRKARKEAE